MHGNIRIITVSRHPAADQVIRDIRDWCDNRMDPSLLGQVGAVTKEIDLASAVKRIADFDDGVKNILIPIGFDESEVMSQIGLGGLQRSNLEVVIRPPRPSPPQELDDPPSSSMLGDASICNVQNTIPALRKSLLRLSLCDRVAVVCLNTREQLRDYFSLRYRVWKEMGYLSSGSDCEQECLELDYTDAAALPIAAHDSSGKMIAGARLVFSRASEIYGVPDYAAMIHELIGDTGSDCLDRNFQVPHSLDHPFDLLKEFDGFKEYYQQLVIRQVSKAEVSRVVVAPKYRHQGIGEVLVDSLVSLARKQHVHELFLACHEKRSAFYEKSGFYALPGLWSEQFCSVNEPSIAMACNLKKRRSTVLH